MVVDSWAITKILLFLGILAGIGYGGLQLILRMQK